jgi:hypothetical protein
MREVVLPSGAFARIRRLTWRDRIEVMKLVAGDTESMWVKLAVRAITLDDKPLEEEQVLDLDWRDSTAIINALVSELTGPVTAARGAEDTK